MAVTPLMGITYPDENLDPWWTTIRNMYLSNDAWLQAVYEDTYFIMSGAGIVGLVGNTMSWSEDIVIFSSKYGTTMTVTAGSKTVLDGETIYITTGTRPITNQTLTLQAGTTITRNDIPIGYRDGANIFLKGILNISSYTLDDAYNASAGASTVAVDAGDLSWNLAGAYSFNIGLTGVTGAVDGFGVENGTDYFRLRRAAANQIALTGVLETMNVATNGAAQLTAGAAADLTLGARGANTPFNEAGQVSLAGGFAAISVIGALNELLGADDWVRVAGAPNYLKTTVAGDHVWLDDGGGVNFGKFSYNAIDFYGTTIVGTQNNGDLSFVPNGTGLVMVGVGVPGNLTPASGEFYVQGDTEVDGRIYADAGISVLGTSYIGSTGSTYIGSTHYLEISVGSDDGTRFFIGDTGGSGNHFFTFSSKNNRTKDHDHDVLQTDPTVVVHSALDPDTDHSEYLAWTYLGLQAGTMETDRATFDLTIKAATANAGATGGNRDGGDVILLAGVAAAGGVPGIVKVGAGAPGHLGTGLGEFYVPGISEFDDEVFFDDDLTITGDINSAADINFTDTTGTTVIQTGAVPGVARAFQFDIPVAAGGAANAALDYQFLLDGVLEAGLLAETDGAGTYRDAVFKIPYMTADYNADWSGYTAPAPASLANGGAVLAFNTNGGAATPTRLYLYSNGGWVSVDAS